MTMSLLHLVVALLLASTTLERRFESVYRRDSFERFVYTVHDIALVVLVQVTLAM